MVFDYLSDVHLEFFGNRPGSGPESALARYWAEIFSGQRSDVLLMAGDIFSGEVDTATVNTFFECVTNRWERVLCVLGNHDYWRETPFRRVKAELAAAWPQVTFLENEVADVGGVRIFGATWWSPIRPSDALCVRFGVRDYERIRGTAEEPFTPELVTMLHRQSLAALTRALEDAPDRPFVVLTHHAPSRLSNSRPADVLTQAFCAADEDFILENPRIRVWVHGHVHERHDYRLGSTRILCNPHGYAGATGCVGTRFGLRSFEV